jgi:hypothetical protein
VFAVIVGEFSRVEPFVPVVLEVVNVGAEVGLKRLVKAFGLAVPLRMEGCGWKMVDLEPITEAFVEAVNKLGAPVGNKCLR